MLPGVFGSLAQEWQAQLLAAGRRSEYRRGETLFYPDDAAETVYVLLRGGVRLYRLSPQAREVTLDVLGPGALLGILALTEGSQSYGVYAEVLDDAEVLELGTDALHRMMQTQPTLPLAEALAQQLQGVYGRLSGLVFLEISQRLALALLQLAAREGEWEEGHLALKERISHQDLAYTVGSTRETVTKLLGEFRARKLLDLGYRRIVLTSREGLEAAVREPLTDSSSRQK